MRLVLSTVLALATVATAPSAPHATDPVRSLTVTARDYGFDAPDSALAGRTLVRFTNQGKEFHHAFLIHLAPGKTPADLEAAFKAGGPPPAWAHDMGGPNAPPPGGTSAAVVTLIPGTYVLLCMIPGPDSVPHVMKGMSRVLTVVPAPTAVPAAGTAGTVNVRDPDVTLTLKDYGFELSRPLTAGQRVVRVTNAAAQSHEVFIGRLAPGAKAHDFVVWAEKMQGRPPLEAMGGATPMSRGQSNDVLLDLTPGEYAFFCFVPDAKDGKMHVDHGMVRQVTVR